MAALNSQFPAGPGSRNPTAVQKKGAEEPDAFSIEGERLAAECKAIKEQYLKEAVIRSKKYEADMRQGLLETYFSDKDIFGDKIFEETGVDGVKASRYAGIDSYADPVAYLEKKEASAKSAANTSTGPETGICLSEPEIQCEQSVEGVQTFFVKTKLAMVSLYRKDLWIPYRKRKEKKIARRGYIL